jgi:ABC-type Zn uptake system ZnuABC Zn-binding protein ZnuA
MKRKMFGIGVAVALGFFPVLSGYGSPVFAAENKLELLATTFPIYQITRNVIQGRDGMTVALMIPAQLGCPHDYALTPQDVRKVAKARVLVINGLGMEAFLSALLEKAGGQLKVVDSSEGIRQILEYEDTKAHEHPEPEEKAHEESGHQVGEHSHVSEEGQHEHSGINSHLFASPRMVALLAENIGAKLAKIDPAGAGIYRTNAKRYADRMNRLADDFVALGRRLKNDRIVTQHGVFDYLARDMGLRVIAVVEAHAGQEPSAAQMLEIVETIRHEKAGAIFTEPQYPEKIGQTLAREAGIATATLDPAATGPNDAPLDYYETVMRNNLVTLEKTLGTR